MVQRLSSGLALTTVGSWIDSGPAAWIGLLAGVILAWLLIQICFPRVFWTILIGLSRRMFYRLDIRGADSLPRTGAALLVCNSLGFVDWLLLQAAVRRPIRFILWVPRLNRRPVLQSLLRWARVIAIESPAGSAIVDAALHQAAAALAAGELVCLFAESRRNRQGLFVPYHRMFEQLVRSRQVPVIPVSVDQLWGSLRPRRDGRIHWKLPSRLPYPVQIAFGAPMPQGTSAGAVRLAIQELSAESAIARQTQRRPVHRQFVRVAARHPFAPCISDSAGKHQLSYSRTLAAAILLSRQLKPLLGDEPMVGIWLPPSVGGCLANLAVTFLGKTAVNLNYTAGPETVESAIQQCGLRHVLTAQAFTARGFSLPDPALAVHLEEFRDRIPAWQKVCTWLMVILLPGWVLDRWILGLHRHRSTDLATIIFSSGSTGEPKGVMLTHSSIMANAESIIQAIDVNRSDRLLGLLPFFHSFGYTVTLWVPLQVGASTVYHYDPRQAEKVGELCRTRRATILLTTPTFLRYYLRRTQPADFASLRLLMCGAEKLPTMLALDFAARFQLEPLEGYGCTELAPAAIANVPDMGINGVQLIGNQPGSIGQPLPGVAIRIVHPETFEPVPLGQEGLLLVTGANVMQGYLGKPELTARSIRDGWYITGDIARCDQDGFVTITGRLSRFAKIGGEMVPLEKIEDELHGILGTSDRVCAVAAVPDNRKGERLVVLHLPIDIQVADLCDQLAGKGLPNLWLPTERDFFQVDEIPVLGSGKLDLQKLQELAMRRSKAAVPIARAC